MKRIISAGKSTERKDCPLETLFLLLFCQTIRQSKISQSVTQFIFEQLPQNYNLTDLNPTQDRREISKSNERNSGYRRTDERRGTPGVTLRVSERSHERRA